MSESAVSKQRVIVCAVLVGLVVVIYGQTCRYDFVNYDDNAYVYENEHTKAGLTFENVRWAFTTGDVSNWHPLTWLSYLLDIQVFGENPGAMHLVNVFFHAINTLLLFLWLSRMTCALWPSALVAALFAVHPLHVESVAWIAERKDVLSTCFWLLTAWAYVSYAEKPGALRYAAVFVLFALGLMAKPMVVTLPAILLLIDYWPLARLTEAGDPEARSSAALKTKQKRKEKARARPGINPGLHGIVWSKLPWLIAEKIPLFCLAAASSVITYLAQHGGKSIVALDVLPLGPRLCNALVSYVRYVLMMVWPKGLAAFYPHPESSLPAWQVAVSVLLLTGITVLVMLAMRRFPYLFVGWLWYIGTLVPVIGVIQVGRQAMADRYTYISLAGLFIIVAWGGAVLAARWQIPKRALAAAAGVVLVALTATAFAQTRHWRDSIALFEHALAVTNGNYLAHRNLGYVLQEDNRLEDAIAHFRQGLAIKPDYKELYADLGHTLGEMGRMEQDPEKKLMLWEEASTKYAEAIQRDANFVRAWYNWGLVLDQLADMEQDPGKKWVLWEEACKKYEATTRCDANYALAWSNWGTKLSQLANMAQDPGKRWALLEDACEKYEEATQHDANLAKAWSNWGTALGKLADMAQDPGKRRAVLQDVCKKFDEAILRDASDAGAWSNWGAALGQLADMEQDPGKKRAVLQDVCKKFDEATQRDANLAGAWNNWGVTLRGLADIEQNPELKQVLLQEAKEKASRANRVTPGTAR